MPRYRVLVSAPYMLPVIDRFADRFRAFDAECVKAAVRERLEEADLLGLVGAIDGIVCGDDRITARVIAAAPRLKVIVKWGTGIDSIDQAAAAARGIALIRTPDAFTEPVADTALGYMLAFARNLVGMDRAMKGGVWEKIPGRALNESTVGVVGVGAAGSAVLRRARGFGATLLGTDIREIHPGHVKALGVAMVPFEELLARADYVSLHCDLNPTSHHLMNAQAFARMKPGAVLINTARGPVVDEAALVEALASGRLGGAGLDVFEAEPLPAASPLRRFPNALLAPHNSNSSPAAWERVHENSLAQLFRHLTNGNGTARPA